MYLLQECPKGHNLPQVVIIYSESSFSRSFTVWEVKAEWVMKGNRRGKRGFSAMHQLKPRDEKSGSNRICSTLLVSQVSVLGIANIFSLQRFLSTLRWGCLIALAFEKRNNFFFSFFFSGNHSFILFNKPDLIVVLMLIREADRKKITYCSSIPFSRVPHPRVNFSLTAVSTNLFSKLGQSYFHLFMRIKHTMQPGNFPLSNVFPSSHFWQTLPWSNSHYIQFPSVHSLHNVRHPLKTSLSLGSKKGSCFTSFYIALVFATTNWGFWPWKG